MRDSGKWTIVLTACPQTTEAFVEYFYKTYCDNKTLQRFITMGLFPVCIHLPEIYPIPSVHLKRCRVLGIQEVERYRPQTGATLELGDLRISLYNIKVKGPCRMHLRNGIVPGGRLEPVPGACWRPRLPAAIRQQHLHETSSKQRGRWVRDTYNGTSRTPLLWLQLFTFFLC